MAPPDASFEEGEVAIDDHGSGTSPYLIVVRADAGIMQEAAQFISAVEPDVHSLANRASFPG